jgi:hypothetical protein
MVSIFLAGISVAVVRCGHVLLKNHNTKVLEYVKDLAS